MSDAFLPIGSVVLVKGADRRLMICGRLQVDVETGETYDYSGCLYPEGIIDSSQFYMFNGEDIDNVFFIGYQDIEEFEFKNYLIEELKKEVNRQSETEQRGSESNDI